MKTGTTVRNQRGSIIVFVVVSLLALMAIVGFVVDFGRFTVAREQLKNAAESSAITAVLTLRKGCPPFNAQRNARNLAHAGNKVDSYEILIDAPDIRIGRFTSLPAPNFLSPPPPGPGGTLLPPNAAEVTARMDASTSSGPFRATFLNELINMTAVAKAKFTPMDLVIVQDTSGSMSGQGINDAKAALNFLVNLIDPNNGGCGGDNDYRVGMVEFGDANQVLVHLSTLAGTGAQNLRNVINALDVGNGTPTHTGISLARGEIAANGRPNYPKAIFLFSDGRPNNFGSARNQVNAAWNSGIFVYTIFTGSTSDTTGVNQNRNLSRPLSAGNSGSPFIDRYAHLANNQPALRRVIQEIMSPRITSW